MFWYVPDIPPNILDNFIYDYDMIWTKYRIFVFWWSRFGHAPNPPPRGMVFFSGYLTGYLISPKTAFS